MRVGIDARFASGRRRGIGNYSLRLIVGLSKRSGIELVLYLDGNEPPPEILALDNVRIRHLSPGLYPVWEQISLPRCARDDGLDLFHSLGNTGPIHGVRGCRFIVTVHDVMYMDRSMKFGGVYQRIGNGYRRMIVPRCARSAHMVITDSDYSKSDILKLIPLDPRNVRVVPLGIDMPQEVLIARQGPRQQAIVVLAAKDPRKNAARVIRCFAQLRSEGGVRMKLVGALPGDVPAVDALVSQLDLAGSVDYCGFLPDEDLLACYMTSAMLVYPSLSEGFGLPVLEAMACGCPVIASNRCSIPEVAGDAAILVDPEDDSALFSAMRSLLGDIRQRTSLSEKGRAQAARFTWSSAAEKTAAVYREVMSRS